MLAVAMIVGVPIFKIDDDFLRTVSISVGYVISLFGRMILWYFGQVS
jgi:hypothetical protein